MSMSMSVSISISMSMSVCVFVCMCAYMRIYVYTCIYICIFIYVYIYTRACTPRDYTIHSCVSRSYMRNDGITFATWFVPVLHDSFTGVTWLILMCDMTLPCPAGLDYCDWQCFHMWHAMCDMEHLHVRNDTCTCVTWLLYTHVTCHVTWHIYTCDMTHARVWHDSLT